MVELSRTAEGKNSDALSGFLPVVYIQLSKISHLKDFAWIVFHDRQNTYIFKFPFFYFFAAFYSVILMLGKGMDLPVIIYNNFDCVCQGIQY
jgi:hypothetical protein